MRGMNLPSLPAPPLTLDECLKIYAQQLEHGVMPFPRASQLMVAYLAWPNDRKQRDRWMATTLALFIAERDRTGSAAQPNLQLGDQSAFELFGGLRTVADVSLVHMTRKLEPIQKRWLHVADILQMVVDIHHEERASISGGASISKAQDILLGYSSLPRRATLSKDWSDFRDVSHLITAAAAVAFLCGDISNGASAVLTPVLLVPEVVLALGLAFQEFGLTFKPYRQCEPILPSRTLWRIPTTNQIPALPIPVRRLSDPDLDYLVTKRRARPKA